MRVKIKRKDLKRIIREEVRRDILLEYSRQDVKDVQTIIGAKADGAWGPNTDKAWYSHISKNWNKDTHGDPRIKDAILDRSYGWSKAYKFFNDATQNTLSVEGNPAGSLAFLNWMKNPEPKAAEGHVPSDVKSSGLQGATPKRDMRSGKATRMATVRSAERGEDDLVVQTGGKEHQLEDWTRRKNKVHILVPSNKGVALDIPGFQKQVGRIKIVFRDRETLRDGLDATNIKKLKVNRRLIKVLRARKYNSLRDVILRGELVPVYQGPLDKE